MKIQAQNTAITIEGATTETTDGTATREGVILLTTETSADGNQAITAVLDLKQARQLADAIDSAINKYLNGVEKWT